MLLATELMNQLAFDRARRGRFMSVGLLLLSLFLGCSTHSSPEITRSTNEIPRVSANNSPADRSSIDNEGSKPLDCADPRGYSLEEGTIPDTHTVNIVRDGTVLHTIKLLTEIERPGFGFDGAKKTKDGFEISVQYGTRIFYAKTFVFICRQHRFYLSKIRVESFDRQNPAKQSRKVTNVRPNVPLEQFSITDFMLEGVVKH